jgi:hypothetical protein
MPTETDARLALQQLVADYNRTTPDQRADLTERDVVHHFINRLLGEVLGWPTTDPARYKYELATQVGRPDITLIPERGGTVFVEAKRFGVIKELKEARKTIQGVITPGQMALPGMAVDRTDEEQQAINYAFANSGEWAILTNFEKLRLFNARRDWLVLSFERPGAYLDEFEQLWQLAYANMLNGSLDRLSNQRYTRDIDSEYLDFINTWRERLAQDIVRRREMNPWAFDARGQIDLLTLRAVVQRFLDRLVVVRFAEDHLVIPAGTLRDFYELRRRNPYTHSMDQYLDQFFRRFDQAHNSALFAEGLVDLAAFSDEVLLPLIGKLYDARYRSMPADIIGNTYEQYLGKALALDNGSVTTRDNLETRKKQGSYYTPQVIVRYLVHTTLGRYLYGTANGQPDGEPVPGETRQTSRDIRDLRVLDSACGSGSFLIYAYYVLADFYEAEIKRLEREAEARALHMAAQGIDPLQRRIELADYTAELERIRDYPRLILENHLYGVDLDPQAAEIAVVNLIMRAMERRQHEKRLPMILGQNIKVGNGLVGLRPDDPRVIARRAEIAEVIRLRRLVLTDPDRHVAQPDRPVDLYDGMSFDEAAAIINPAARQKALEEITRRINQPFEMPQGTGHPTYDLMTDTTRAVADQLDAEIAPHFSDLERVRPFHWGIEFPEVFFDDQGQPLENPGFTIIVGNPPWEIVKPDLREYFAQFDPDIESKLNRKQTEQRIEELKADDPRRVTEFEAQTRLIEENAAYYRACGDYMRQGKGDTATHKLFLERMYGLLRQEGRIGYVVPSGIYTDLGTKDLREMLLNEGNIQYIYSFSNERFFFPGVHHSFKFTLLGAQKGPQSDGFWAAFRFNPRVAVAPDDLPAFLDNPNNLIYMRRESLEKFSPDSLSLMEFQAKRDYSVTETIYGDWPLIGEIVPEKWSVKFTNEFHMTNDRHLFNVQASGLPLYEGKMIHHFDAMYGEPQYWIVEEKGRESLRKQAPNGFDYQFPRLAIRTIARTTDERTLICTILPSQVFCGNSLYVEVAHSLETRVELYTQAVMSSFIVDFVLRQKIAANVNLFYLYQLPLPRLTPGDPFFDAIVPRAARLTCTRAEFADLWQQVMGDPWDESKGAVDPAERQRLRDEIDAIVAHLYGLSRADFDHILGTFPLVFPDTDAGRAKRSALMDTYDQWAGVVKSWPRA